MTPFVPVVKDQDHEGQVPSVWRSTLGKIVEAFRQQDFRLEYGPEGVAAISDADARHIAANLKAYGGSLTSLPEETWASSVYRWQEDFWEILIDLFTLEEGSIDLILCVRAFESQDGYRFEVRSVHVR